MFTISEYLSTPYANAPYPITVRDDEFLVRRMNGLESLQLEDLNTAEERCRFVLANCLYDGVNRKPLGSIHAENFIRQYGGLAIDVTTSIITETANYENSNRRQMEIEIKNSEATVSPVSTGNTAKGSDSTPNSHNQQKGVS